jgi:hypothetical protein
MMMLEVRASTMMTSTMMMVLLDGNDDASMRRGSCSCDLLLLV